MITVEYDCWKCGEWHTATLETEAELEQFTETVGVAVRRIP